MAIERRGGLVVISCDGCDTEEESDRGETFDEMWGRLKLRGWTSRSLTGKANGVAMWVNLCASCQRDERL